MNTRGCDEIKNPFCVSSKKYVSKITIKLHIGLVTRKYISLDIDEFFLKTPKVDKKQASVTGNIEEEENTAKKITYDADENAEENEIIQKDKEKVVTI